MASALTEDYGTVLQKGKGVLKEPTWSQFANEAEDKTKEKTFGEL